MNQLTNTAIGIDSFYVFKLVNEKTINKCIICVLLKNFLYLISE